jgi:NADH:ubiquinone oxidoreductase subunit K
MQVELAHYLLLSAVLFGIGVIGVLTRKNLIVILNVR